MSLVQMNWQPSDRQLRQFGVIALIALPALGWLWTNYNWTVILSLAGVGLALMLLSFAFPKAIKPIYVLLSLAAIPIGIVVSELVMLLVYYGLFLPLGLLFRITGRDVLQLKLDRNAESYWQTKKQPSGPGSYYRQS